MHKTLEDINLCDSTSGLDVHISGWLSRFAKIIHGGHLIHRGYASLLSLVRLCVLMCVLAKYQCPTHLWATVWASLPHH